MEGGDPKRGRTAGGESGCYLVLVEDITGDTKYAFMDSELGVYLSLGHCGSDSYRFQSESALFARIPLRVKDKAPGVAGVEDEVVRTIGVVKNARPIILPSVSCLAP